MVVSYLGNLVKFPHFAFLPIGDLRDGQLGKKSQRSKAMSERTKLLKKAVLASVGALTNVERIKSALSDAMQDLVKVGQGLFDELEDKGKAQADNVQQFLKNLQDEAGRRTAEAEKKVSTTVSTSTKKAAKELGLVTREDLEELLDRVAALEEALNHPEEEGDCTEGRKTRAQENSAQRELKLSELCLPFSLRRNA